MRKSRLLVPALMSVAVLGLTASSSVVATAAEKITQVFITNTPAAPVPTRPVGDTPVRGAVAVTELPDVRGAVSINGTPTVRVENFPTETAQPRWTGEPYMRTRVMVNITDLACEALPIPTGKVLYLERAATAFNVPPGTSGYARLELRLVGGHFAYLVIPAHPGSPVRQIAGMFDGYEGSIDVGQPVEHARACFAGSTTLNGEVTLMGYTIPAPTAPTP